MTLLFELKSAKAIVLKSVLEILKNCIKETNILIDKEGLKISSLGVFTNTLIYLKLDANKFESFNVSRPVFIGVNTEILYNTLKLVARREIVTLAMDTDCITKLLVKVADELEGRLTTYEVNLLALEDNFADVHDIEYDSITDMPTAHYQKIIKNMELVDSKILEIQSFENQLIFACDDGNARVKMVITEVDSNLNTEQRKILAQNGEEFKFIKFEHRNDIIIQGKYNMGFLKIFLRATHLCDVMKIYLANDKPMILEYTVGDMGIIRFMITPVVSV